MKTQTDMNAISAIDVFQALKQIPNVSDAQAKRIADSLVRIGDAATKTDLAATKTDLNAAIQKLNDRIKHLETSAATKADLAAVKAAVQRLNDRVEHLETSMNEKIENTATKADVKGLADKIEKTAAVIKAESAKSNAQTTRLIVMINLAFSGFTLGAVGIMLMYLPKVPLL